MYCLGSGHNYLKARCPLAFRVVQRFQYEHAAQHSRLGLDSIARITSGILDGTDSPRDCKCGGHPSCDRQSTSKRLFGHYVQILVDMDFS